MSTMLDLIGETPAQLRWAAELEVPAVPAARAGIVMGMGGSGIAGDAALVVAAESGARVTVHKSYGLPRWVSDELVVAISHSGNTEETASAVDAALAGRLSLVGITTGGALADRAVSDGFALVRVPAGPQPRAAFGYLAGAAVRILEAAGVVGSQRAGLLEAADAVEEILTGDGPQMADEIAGHLAGRAAFVYGGSGVGAVAANRWKTQINENSKAPAAWIDLPEGNHNDIVSWTGYPALSADSIATVFLDDSGDHPRVSLRSRLTRDLIEASVPIAGVVRSRGTGALARLFSLVIIGDLVSVALAARSGVDPMPVDVIQDLKARLAQENG
jgi:glucose/mannose-6-phosphate isomerase